MRLFLIKILYRLLYWEYQLEYKHSDKVAMEKWLYTSFQNRGAMDYMRVEELKVLKNMARGLNHEQYWTEVGKRQQLALIVNDFQKIFEIKQSEQLKVQAELKRKLKQKKNESTSNSIN